MMTLYTEILYRPLFNAVVFLYNVLPGHDFGLAIIALTAVIRILFFPLSIRTVRSQKAISQLNPKLQEIKQKFKDDKSAQSAETMKLYKENNINPLAGCLPLIIQLPILIALYGAFIAGLKPENLNMLYGFISNPGIVNKMSLGFIDVTSKMPLLAFFAGVAQFVQAWAAKAQNQASTANKEMAALNSQMLYFFPIMIIIIGWNLPAGLVLYWITTTVFSILEQLYIKYND
ncbi:MAG: membrane protein insertase YidC [Candidatus Yanofskybacteria bacterium]|nr:membrane protein insertase YidC [Candidatus Yanofskybacteria bacterium]